MKKVRKLLALVMSLAMIMSVVVAPQAANAAIDAGEVWLVYTGSGTGNFDVAVSDTAVAKYPGFVNKTTDFAGYVTTIANFATTTEAGTAGDTGYSNGEKLVPKGSGTDLYATVLANKTTLATSGLAVVGGLSGDTIKVKLPLQVVAYPSAAGSPAIGNAQLIDSKIGLEANWVDVTLKVSELSNYNLGLAATPRPTDPAAGALALSVGKTEAQGGTAAFPANYQVTENPLGQGGYVKTDKMISFLAKKLVPGVEYTYTVRAHKKGARIDDFSTDSCRVLATGTIPASKVTDNQAKIEIAWDGTDVNGTLLPWSEIFYTVNVASKKGFANVNGAATVATDVTGYKGPSVYLDYDVYEANIPTFTPGTESTITVNLGKFNRTTMGNVFAVITRKSLLETAAADNLIANADTVLAVIENTGTDLIANFKWNGQYTKDANTVVGFENFNGYYDDDAVAGRPVPKTGDGQYYMYLMTEKVSWYTKGEGKIVVGQSGPYLFGTSTKYVNGAGSQIDFLQTKNGRVTFRVEGSNAYLPVTVTVKNNVNEVVHTIPATTDANGVVDIPWTGLLADNTNYIADGVYRVEATITNNANTNTKDSILYVGMPVRVIGISTKDSVITVGAGNAYTDVELVFNPTTATTRMIKEIKLYNDNNYFTIDGNMKNYTDKTFRILGLKNSEGKTITGLAKVTFMDGNTTDLTLNVNVSKASTGITNVSTILREAAGTTGKKITFEYTPAGTNGEMPTFYPIKKDADGKIIKLEGAELDSANSIATVNEKGEVTFKAPGRVLYGVKFEDQVYDVVICTTTEFIQQLVMYPLDGEVSIKAGLSEDASKQPRVAAYARPVYLADTKVTYTTSDRNAVYFRYAVADASSITNDSANVPAGAYAGALVGVKGEAVITAKSAALTTDSEPLEEQITVTVAE